MTHIQLRALLASVTLFAVLPGSGCGASGTEGGAGAGGGGESTGAGGTGGRGGAGGIDGGGDAGAGGGKDASDAPGGGGGAGGTGGGGGVGGIDGGGDAGSGDGKDASDAPGACPPVDGGPGSGALIADGWESGRLTGSGAAWYALQAVSGYGYAIVEDVVRQGKFAARIEVRPGDNPLACCAGTERSEVLALIDASGKGVEENLASGTKYFAFSVRLDSSWKSPVWSVLFQLHGPDSLGTNPSFSFSIVKGVFVVGGWGGDISTNPLKEYPLKNDALNPGKWIDFVVGIRFAVDTTGSVTVWRRDEGSTTFDEVLNTPKVATLQYKGSPSTLGDHYWKFGLYRSAATFTNVLWNDGFARGDTFEAVATAFCR